MADGAIEKRAAHTAAAAGRELEIKLVGAPADVAGLRASRLVAALGDGSGGWERLVSTYYDTPDGALAAEGLTLRLREEAAGRVQAIKRARAGEGSFSRAEEDIALSADEAFPGPPRDPSFAEAIARHAGGLAPVARIAADRWAVTLARPGARIEAAFDIGRAEAYRDGVLVASAPLAEAELELLEGDPAALFDAAALLIEESGGRLRLGAASKADQARRLLRPAAIAPEANLALDPGAPAAEALGAALAAAAARVIDLVPVIVEQRLPEGVHQMRVALRRLRAVLRIFRKAAASPALEALAAHARDVARALGPARDWDVFCEETVPPLAGAGLGEEGRRALLARAHAARAAAWAEAAATVADIAFTRFALDLLRTAHLRPWRDGAGAALEQPTAAFARRALDKRLAAAARMAATLAGEGPAARHPLRIELKKLRYAAQTFRSLYPRARRKPYMAAMSRLQDGFGALNDAVVAQRLADAAALGQGGAAQRAAGFVAGYRAREADHRAEALLDDWAAFAAMTPFWADEE